MGYLPISPFVPASAGEGLRLQRQRPGLCGPRQGLRSPQIQNALYCACQDVSEFIAGHGRHDKVKQIQHLPC